MINICFLLSIICAIPLVSKEIKSQEADIVSEVKWGRNEGEAGLINLEETERCGPLSFYISESGDDILLLDTVNRRVMRKVGDNNFGVIAKNVVGWSICEDKNNGFFVLNGQGVCYYSERGVLEEEFLYNGQYKTIEGYGSELTLSRGKYLELNNVDQKAFSLVEFSENGKIKNVGYESKVALEGRTGITHSELRFKIKRISGKDIRILGSDKEGKILVTVPLNMDGDKFGAVLFKGQDDKGNLYVEVERIVDNRAKLEVHRYSPKGEILKIYELPNKYYTTVYKKTQITPNGDVYQLLTTEKGVSITRY